MSTLEYLFGVILGEQILRHTDNLSKTFQNLKLCSSEGFTLVEIAQKTLKSLRNEESFDMFWLNLISEQQRLDVDEPVLPRKHGVPQNISSGTTPSYHTSNPKEHFRKQFYECFDFTIAY